MGLSDSIELIEHPFINTYDLKRKKKKMRPPMMYLAFCRAARVQSTLGPSEQYPWASGGVTCIRATSTGMILR